jgi:hypothetical protein
MARRRRMSALQRKYFGRRSRRSSGGSRVRTVYRSTRRAARSYRRSFGRSSWLPLSGREHLTAAITGVTAPVAVYYGRQIVPSSWLAMLGGYGDEVVLYAEAALAHKFLPGGLIKDAAKDHARLAVMSAANQAISPMLSSVIGITGTSSLGGSLASIGYI